MPIFKCSQCGTLDNTAGGGSYWGQPKDKVKCCECETGKWHDYFPKGMMEEKGYVQQPDGFYGPVGGWK